MAQKSQLFCLNQSINNLFLSQLTSQSLDNIKQSMSRHINSQFKQTKTHLVSIKDFNYSVDVKRFSRQRNNQNMTPAHNHFNQHKQLQVRNNERIRNSQPLSLNKTATPSKSLSKPTSSKNMKTKRKLSSGFHIFKTNHHSVSIDHHLLKEKYNFIRELHQNNQHAKAVHLIRQTIIHFQYSQEQKNLYYWLALSLGHLKRYQEALEQISEGLQLYPSFVEGLLLSAELHLKLKQYSLAITQIREVIHLNPRSQEGYLQLAFCYGAMGDVRQQMDVLKLAVQTFPKQGLFYMFYIQLALVTNGGSSCGWCLDELQRAVGRRASLWLYAGGLLEGAKGHQQQAYIMFEQALRFNNHKAAVNRSLLQIIKIQIFNRDFYKAYHSIGRIKHLQLQQTDQIKVYSRFIEGAMTMMKKKSEQAIKILLSIPSNNPTGSQSGQQLNIKFLTHKYLAYGYFKVGNYQLSAKYYRNISPSQMDASSQYNLHLAQGIQLADRSHRFKEAEVQFQKAAQVYPRKVEPHLYIAMINILEHNISKPKDEVSKAQTLISALRQMEEAYLLNPNSSNLLYHRTIIHLYFQDWEQAHEDINRCIQKAQENLPKYFYLRGVCYSCVRDFKKAINQFAICLSLDASHQDAHFQKAKCHFLLGSTQKGFSSLKSFIELNPDDLSIYKWIGDLLYEGRSYRDAMKSYAEYQQVDNIEVLIMKAKCQLRIDSLQDVNVTLKQIGRHPNAEIKRVQLDQVAVNLVFGLTRGQSSKVVVAGVHKLNKLLQESTVGYVFELIDCMSLMGVASFYLRKYQDAYQSFLLVLQLYQSLCEKNSNMITAEQTDQQLDLRSEDIYFNIVICELARNHMSQALQLIQNQYIHTVSEAKQKQKIQRLMVLLQKGMAQHYQWQFKTDKPINHKLKTLEIVCNRVHIKTKPVFNLHHDSTHNLYTSQVAERMINQFHAAYIDSMPEGPWIRRNPHGVVFTDDVMPQDISVSLENTVKTHSSRSESESCYQIDESKKTVNRRDQLLRGLQLDQGVEQKLRRLVPKKE